MARYRIFFALFASYLISAVLMNYVSYGDKPVLETGKIAVHVAQAGTRLRAGITSFSSGLFKRPAGNIEAIPVSPTQSPPVASAPVGQSSSGVDFSRLPTSTPLPLPPTYPPSSRSSSSAPRVPTVRPTAKPTAKPAPTEKPKPPTATPVPELAPITTDVRPGSSVDEIFADVQKRLCVPAALLKSIQSEETGQRFLTNAQAKFSTLNTYGWWNNDGLTINDLFLAAAYSAQSGKAPSDGKFAGQQIATGIQPGAYDQMIMGMLQVSQQEQDASFKNTSKIITTGKIDRRVLYDNALIFASVTKNKVGNLAETGCGDWSFKAIARAACKHLGGCNYNYGANNGNYCTKICTHYNEFAGTNYDCANAASLMEANGDDGQCTLK